MDKSNHSNNNRWSVEEPKLRVEKEHGGQNVEEITVGSLESFNDAECEHKTVSRDMSETEFVAWQCDNPDCNMIFLNQPT